MCAPGTVGQQTLTQVKLRGHHSGADSVTAAAAAQVEIIPPGSEEVGHGDTRDDSEGGVVRALQDVAPGDIATGAAGGVSATGKDRFSVNRALQSTMALMPCQEGQEGKGRLQLTWQKE